CISVRSGRTDLESTSCGTVCDTGNISNGQTSRADHSYHAGGPPMGKKKSDAEFTTHFKSIDKDIERYLEKSGTHGSIDGMPAVWGYDAARETIFKLYLANQQFEAVARYLTESWSWHW